MKFGNLLEQEVKERLAKAEEKAEKAANEVMMWKQLLELATQEQRKLT